jgi:uncharacterized protein YdiU (UPF0061 family)
MEAFSRATVFSSIDHGGRYAYGQQPNIAHWNLARLGEAMLPLFAPELEAAAEAANAVLATFAGRFDAHWLAGMRAKLGLTTADPGDLELVNDLLALLEAQAIDMTSAFRALSPAAGGDLTSAHELFAETGPFDAWTQRWRARLGREARSAATVAAEMDRINPVYIPRNQLVEDALAAAGDGDLTPYEELLTAVTHPFDPRPGYERYALPSTPGAPYRTFCGT